MLSRRVLLLAGGLPIIARSVKKTVGDCPRTAVPGSAARARRAACRGSEVSKFRVPSKAGTVNDFPNACICVVFCSCCVRAATKASFSAARRFLAVLGFVGYSCRPLGGRLVSRRCANTMGIDCRSAAYGVPFMLADYLLLGAIGFVAQLVDGALGMAFGVISTSTMMTMLGVPVAQASAIVHTAEVFTTAASAVSHIAHRNVDWGLVARLGIGGMIGAVAGAWLLSNVDASAARPFVAAYLLLLGLFILLKAARKIPKT